MKDLSLPPVRHSACQTHMCPRVTLMNLRRSAVYVALLVSHGIVASLATTVIARLQGVYIALNILYDLPMPAALARGSCCPLADSVYLTVCVWPSS